MQQAIALSLENVRSGTGGPFAALVIRGGSVLASGTNQVITLQDPTAHAEVVAIRTACQAAGSFQLSDCELYTTCEPCPMCMGAIYWARVARVYYASTRDDALRVTVSTTFFSKNRAFPPRKPERPLRRRVRGKKRLEGFDAWDNPPSKGNFY